MKNRKVVFFLIVKFNFLSKCLQMQTNVTMCLPSFSFADQMNGRPDVYVPGVKFQTLYLLHGGFGDDSDYINFTNIARYADEHKVAVIMPNGYNSFYTDSSSGGLSSKYWEYVFEELPQVCSTMFPISTKREDTFVAGLSMGAHGAMKMALLGSERYAAALIMSGAAMNVDAMTNMSSADGENSAQLDPQMIAALVQEQVVREDDSIYKQAKRNIEEGRPVPKLFFTCGDQDFILPAVHKAKDLMQAYGYDVLYEEVPGYGHEWDFWDLSLRKAFKEWLPIRNDVIFPK
ncbi:MAG TPA: alpha/beta hydrolase family protein [Paenibacillus sp.]|jgi:S-formylglutathione hydrolase FrmB